MTDKFVSMISGFLSGLVCSLLGCWDYFLSTLLCFIVIDIITGIVNATIKGELKSSIMFIGGVRKGIIILVICIGHMLDGLIGIDNMAIRNCVCGFYIAMEGISIFENLGCIGVPLPKFLKEILETLKDKTDSGEEVL